MRGAGGCGDAATGGGGTAGRVATGGAGGVTAAAIGGATGFSTGGATTAGGGGTTGGRGGTAVVGAGGGGGATGFSGGGAITAGRTGAAAGIEEIAGRTGAAAGVDEIAGGATGFGGAAGATTGLAAMGGGAGGRIGGAAASFFCVMAFSTSPGREMWERSILVLISSSPRRGRAFLAACVCDSAEPRMWARTFSASWSSIELECVFFSVTPTSGSASRMALLLTSNSLARSLIRTLLIRPFLYPALCSKSSSQPRGVGFLHPHSVEDACARHDYSLVSGAEPPSGSCSGCSCEAVSEFWLRLTAVASSSGAAACASASPSGAAVSSAEPDSKLAK